MLRNSKLDGLFEDFRETWTAIEEVQDKVCTIDSKVDHLEFLIGSIIDLLLGHV